MGIFSPIRLQKNVGSGKKMRFTINQICTSLKNPSGAPQPVELGKRDGRKTKNQEYAMSNITMKEMLEAGLHFGHQTHRWNPKMKPYIFGARSKIYIINLDKTLPLFNKAYQFVINTVAQGGVLLFVGTKRQARDIISEEAERCDMYFVNNRWLGGMLTNFQTIKKSIDRLKNIEAMREDGSINQYKKKEMMRMEKDAEKLVKNLGGIKNMKQIPSALFVVDPKREKIAVEEANRLGIPVIAMLDTNCDPDGIDFPIPGNDDAIRSIKLITSKVAEAVLAGKDKYAEAGQAETDKGEEPEVPVIKAESAPAEEAPTEEAPTEEAPAAAETPTEETTTENDENQAEA